MRLPCFTFIAGALALAALPGSPPLLAQQTGVNPDITGFHRLSNQVLLNDLAFETNQALWDRYFLSAIPRSSSGSGTWDKAKPLPNPRLKINPVLSKGGDLTELGDFHRAARGLWLEGGFNVHSTNPDAWKSQKGG